jgi:hypothetical protein
MQLNGPTACSLISAVSFVSQYLEEIGIGAGSSSDYNTMKKSGGGYICDLSPTSDTWTRKARRAAKKLAQVPASIQHKSVSMFQARITVSATDKMGKTCAEGGGGVQSSSSDREVIIIQLDWVKGNDRAEVASLWNCLARRIVETASKANLDGRWPVF